ncbi:hypothetical protein O9G_004882 [Rozella allomycis CSF55]|uniref:Uncharacterized protein n=1 Tax=Rozella allomycis (strain CSF55) TaxID=988480 RepID=A0A075AMF7_ROZAC|nr:hypothetical protein O9G_004882 [Rozella allomycis CSF55]|eukprot:EPZ30768.1 hypothetical protein O9G_004882 [Rozella allomycis CSF55]
MELLANPGNNKLPVFCINEKECFKLPLGQEAIRAEPKEDRSHKRLGSILTPLKENETWFELLKEYTNFDPIKECFKLPLGKKVIWAEPKEDLIHKLLVKLIMDNQKDQF